MCFLPSSRLLILSVTSIDNHDQIKNMETPLRYKKVLQSYSLPQSLLWGLMPQQRPVFGFECTRTFHFIYSFNNLHKTTFKYMMMVCLSVTGMTGMRMEVPKLFAFIVTRQLLQLTWWNTWRYGYSPTAPNKYCDVRTRGPRYSVATSPMAIRFLKCRHESFQTNVRNPTFWQTIHPDPPGLVLGLEFFPAFLCLATLMPVKWLWNFLLANVYISTPISKGSKWLYSFLSSTCRKTSRSRTI